MLPRSPATSTASLRHALCAAAFVCALATGAQPATVAGVDIPETFSVEGNSLQINGFGIRTATVLKAKVFVMALYTPMPIRSPDTLLAGSIPLRVWQYYLRDVDSGMIARGWHESLHSHNPSQTGIESRYTQFATSIGRLHHGSVVTYDCAADSVVVTVDGARRPAVHGALFRRALLAVWFGPHSSQPRLRDELLGIAR